MSAARSGSVAKFDPNGDSELLASGKSKDPPGPDTSSAGEAKQVDLCFGRVETCTERALLQEMWTWWHPRYWAVCSKTGRPTVRITKLDPLDGFPGQLGRLTLLATPSAVLENHPQVRELVASARHDHQERQAAEDPHDQRQEFVAQGDSQSRTAPHRKPEKQ